MPYGMVVLVGLAGFLLLLVSASSFDDFRSRAARTSESPKGIPLSQLVQHSSHPINLTRQRHFRQTPSSSSMLSPREEEVVGVAKLIIVTPAGVATHPSHHVHTPYDPVRAFREEFWIASNSLQLGILDNHTPDLFKGLEYQHLRVLFLYLSGQADWTRFLEGWDDAQVRSKLDRLSAEDLTVLCQSPQAAWYLGLFFTYIPPMTIQKATISPRKIIDMLCFLSGNPSLAFARQQYGLDYILKHFSAQWIRQHLNIMSMKLGLPLVFKERDKSVHVAVYDGSKGQASVESFFKSSAVIEDGRRPFTLEDFDRHSPGLFKDVNENHVESFFNWVAGVPFCLPPDKWHLGRAGLILSKLTQSDLEHLLELPASLYYLAKALPFIDADMLPTSLKPEEWAILLSHISNDVSEGGKGLYDPETLKRFSEPLLEQLKPNIATICLDHYPRTTQSIPPPGLQLLCRMTPEEVEDFFRATGTILDNHEPFSAASFARRSPRLLVGAPPRALNNFAEWALAGDPRRARGICRSLTEAEIQYFQSMNLIQLLAPLFPLLDLSVVANANLRVLSVHRLLSCISTHPDPANPYAYAWDVLEGFPSQFFENKTCAEALVERACRLLEFFHLPLSVMKRLHTIYGEQIPNELQAWIQLSLQYTVEETEEAYEQHRAEAERLLAMPLAVSDKEKARGQLTEIANNFETKKNEMKDAYFELEMATSGQRKGYIAATRDVILDVYAAIEPLRRLCGILMQLPVGS